MRTKTGFSPLYVACRIIHEGIGKLLLQNGADVNLRNDASGSPISLIRSIGHESMMCILLNSSANVNSYNNPRVSALYTAREIGQCNDSEINLCVQVEQNEDTPLSIVARRNVRKKKKVSNNVNVTS